MIGGLEKSVLCGGVVWYWWWFCVFIFLPKRPKKRGGGGNHKNCLFILAHTPNRPNRSNRPRGSPRGAEGASLPTKGTASKRRGRASAAQLGDASGAPRRPRHVRGAAWFAKTWLELARLFASMHPGSTLLSVFLSFLFRGSRGSLAATGQPNWDGKRMGRYLESP